MFLCYQWEFLEWLLISHTFQTTQCHSPFHTCRFKLLHYLTVNYPSLSLNIPFIILLLKMKLCFISHFLTSIVVFKACMVSPRMGYFLLMRLIHSNLSKTWFCYNACIRYLLALFFKSRGLKKKKIIKKIITFYSTSSGVNHILTLLHFTVCPHE